MSVVFPAHSVIKLAKSFSSEGLAPKIGTSIWVCVHFLLQQHACVRSCARNRLELKCTDPGNSFVILWRTWCLHAWCVNPVHAAWILHAWNFLSLFEIFTASMTSKWIEAGLEQATHLNTSQNFERAERWHLWAIHDGVKVCSLVSKHENSWKWRWSLEE